MNEEIARVGPQLNIDLLIELLTRLPIRKLSQFIRVSKLWYSIIRDDRFARAYSNRKPLCLVVSIPQNRLLKREQSVNLFNLSVCDDDFIDSGLGLTQVINGLFCYYSGSQSFSFLSNIFTQETMKLPAPPNFDCSNDSQYYFGFDPVNKVYKLLCIMSPRELSRSSCSRVKILTIGRNSSWRELGNGDDIPNGFDRQSTLVNGVLYWLHLLNRGDGYRVYSFDLITEEFTSVSIPIPRFGLPECCFVQFRRRLALGSCVQYSTKLTIYTFEDDQKWNHHQLNLPEELRHERYGWQYVHIGNMPAGEMLLVDHRHISDPSSITPVYIYNDKNHEFDRLVVEKLPWLDVKSTPNPGSREQSIVSIVCMQQNILLPWML